MILLPLGDLVILDSLAPPCAGMMPPMPANVVWHLIFQKTFCELPAWPASCVL